MIIYKKLIQRNFIEISSFQCKHIRHLASTNLYKRKCFGRQQNYKVYSLFDICKSSVSQMLVGWLLWPAHDEVFY